MRVLAVLIVMVVACLTARSQTNIFPSTGNVGIGTTTPTSKLDVKGGITSVDNIKALNPANVQAMAFLGWSNNVARIRIGGSGIGAGNGFDIQVPGDISVMRILTNGNIGISTTTPSEKLSVNGNIRAKEIKVEAANWPDYVFEEGYQIPSLSETETFIKQHRHLPGIPNKDQVANEGISLGEMNRKLLEKVEELTLHLIKVNARLDSLSTENATLKQQIHHK